LVLLLVTAAALAATGDLTQPAGTAGCISDTGAGPCADGHRLSAYSVAVSADGKSVYVAGGDSVVRLIRNTTTGAITQPAGTAGCVSETGAGPCANGHSLYGAEGVAVSPDGKSVYVAVNVDPSRGLGAVVRLNRNPTTGAIAQPAGAAGCVSVEGLGPCAEGRALGNATSVAVSPNGKSVYVASLDGVAHFNRNTTTGAIAQPAGTAGCIAQSGDYGCAVGHGLRSPTSVAVSPDGKSVYAGSNRINAVARLSRNPTTGTLTQPAGTAGCISESGAGPCANGHGLVDPTSVAVSTDGKSVYVASRDEDPPGDGAVARLVRNPTTGAITQPAGTTGCISETGAGTCADGHGLDHPYSVAVSADGKSVYATSWGVPDTVARFNRNPTTGAITQPAGTTGCISETGAGTCADGHAIVSPLSVAVSPDGKNVYAGGGAVVRLNRVP
jgi:DNA-binding beta-propeller fold protein YncE